MSRILSSIHRCRSGRTASRLQEHFANWDILTVDTSSSEDSLSLWLWQHSQDIAKEALETKYMQGIKDGNLDPNNYGAYSVQDAVYCFNAMESYDILSKRSTGDIKEFAIAREKGYENYNKEVFSQWHIKDPRAIELGQAAFDYSKFERSVAQTMDPMYTIVAMIPCERLWSWMASQLKSFATEHNLYSFWINENLTDEGAKRLEAFVDEHSSELDKYKALDVYQNCMNGEVNFFASAVPE